MFFIFFLLLMFGGLAYALWHVWCILPFPKLWKWVVVATIAISFFGMFFIFGGGIERMSLGTASAIYQIGTSMLFILLYLVMIFIVLDLLRLVHLLPSVYLHDNWAATLSITGFLVVLFSWGNINYHNKVRVPMELNTDKPLAKDYKIVMMSDLHLGYHNRRAEFARWVDMVNNEHPDIILIAGDIVDKSVRPLMEENVAEEFLRLEAPVYACLGNHEFYSYQPKAKEFMAAAGIHLLQDSCVSIDGSICIIGRDDRTNPSRKPLKDLIASAPQNQYTIVLDHQPYHLDEAATSGIDFQLSGHTHRGQVWPISWITDALYECSWGSYQRDHTHYYISSGIGLWGGKFRIGTQSEYVAATLKRE